MRLQSDQGSRSQDARSTTSARVLVAGLPPAVPGRLPEDRPEIHKSMRSPRHRSPRRSSAPSVQLGKDLGLKTLAEGVETLGQMEHLRGEARERGPGLLPCSPSAAPRARRATAHPPRSGNARRSSVAVRDRRGPEGRWMSSRVSLRCAPHPDDEVLGAGATLLRLRRGGWHVVDVVASLGRLNEHSLRRRETVEAATRAGFELVVPQPPLSMSHGDDRVAAEAQLRALLVEPHRCASTDVGDLALTAGRPFGHELVVQAVRDGIVDATESMTWWMGTVGGSSVSGGLLAFSTSVLSTRPWPTSSMRTRVNLTRNDYRTVPRSRPRPTQYSGASGSSASVRERRAKSPTPKSSARRSGVDRAGSPDHRAFSMSTRPSRHRPRGRSGGGCTNEAHKPGADHDSVQIAAHTRECGYQRCAHRHRTSPPSQGGRHRERTGPLRRRLAELGPHGSEPCRHGVVGPCLESSISRLLWAHNDSGDTARVFAVGRDGRDRGTVTVSGATAIDWEDIALGPAPHGKPYLYAGDIGDNFPGDRESPSAACRTEAAGFGSTTSVATRSVTLNYPDGRARRWRHSSSTIDRATS